MARMVIHRFQLLTVKTARYVTYKLVDICQSLIQTPRLSVGFSLANLFLGNIHTFPPLCSRSETQAVIKEILSHRCLFSCSRSMFTCVVVLVLRISLLGKFRTLNISSPITAPHAASRLIHPHATLRTASLNQMRR